jgi:hypothetical protein
MSRTHHSRQREISFRHRLVVDSHRTSETGVVVTTGH